jgi:hypothetical protein
VINFAQTHPSGGDRFDAATLAGLHRDKTQERQAQRIRGLRRALFADGDGSKGPGLSLYSTRNGGRMDKARGDYSASAGPGKMTQGDAGRLGWLGAGAT